MKTAELLAKTNRKNDVEISGENMRCLEIFGKASGFHITSHAMHRSQQRCIPPLIIYWLCQYGERKRNDNGTTLCYFDRKSIRLIASDVGHIIVRRLDSLMNSYLVMSGKNILTVGHRYKRIKNF